MDELTPFLEAVESGDTHAADKLFPLVYTELRSIAAHKMAHERDGHTLQPTALVHEAFIRLAGKGGEQRQWKNSRQFLAASAEAMRRVLIDRARRRLTAKRGGDHVRVTWDESKLEANLLSDDVLAIDEALQKLQKESPDLAEIVKLRYFVGLTMEEIAAAQECSLRTVERHWRIARTWLFREVSG